MIRSPRITPFLWFDGQAEEAARFYTSVFPDSSIGEITRFPDEGDNDNRDCEPGGVITVAFTLSGQPFTALNGGPHYQFSEAISFAVDCADQQEVDTYRDALSDGGPVESQRCGWLKDRFGLSWQIVPENLPDLLAGPGSERVMATFMKMTKINIASLEAASESGQNESTTRPES